MRLHAKPKAGDEEQNSQPIPSKNRPPPPKTTELRTWHGLIFGTSFVGTSFVPDFDPGLRARRAPCNSLDELHVLTSARA